MTFHFVHASPITGNATALADALSESDHWLYQTTTDERSALEWIGGRYAVSAVILDSLDDDGVIDLGWAGAGLDIREALAADGIDRVPCLSEDTDLAYLVWLLGPLDGAE